MKRLSAVLLMPEATGRKTCDIAKQVGLNLNAVIVASSNGLEGAFLARRELLLSFGTGVIVPSHILKTPGLLSLNVHAASPRYPGRDPHHFAVYDGAEQYGATMHYMTQSVDAGPITDVELFDVLGPVTPSDLLERANEAGWALIERFFRRFVTQGAPVPLLDLAWGGRKTTRRMFEELCRIDPTMPAEEFERRIKATEMPGHRNLYIDIHGHRFRIEDCSQ